MEDKSRLGILFGIIGIALGASSLVWNIISFNIERDDQLYEPTITLLDYNEVLLTTPVAVIPGNMTDGNKTFHHVKYQEDAVFRLAVSSPHNMEVNLRNYTVLPTYELGPSHVNPHVEVTEGYFHAYHVKKDGDTLEIRIPLTITVPELITDDPWYGVSDFLTSKIIHYEGHDYYSEEVAIVGVVAEFRDIQTNEIIYEQLGTAVYLLPVETQIVNINLK